MHQRLGQRSSGLLASALNGVYYPGLVVLRRVLQLASLACLATLCLFYPLIEALDDVDSPIPASDLEIEFIVVLTFVGIVFLLAHLLASVAICVVMDVLRNLLARITAGVQITDLSVPTFESPSPPLPLRI